MDCGYAGMRIGFTHRGLYLCLILKQNYLCRWRNIPRSCEDFTGTIPPAGGVRNSVKGIV